MVSKKMEVKKQESSLWTTIKEANSDNLEEVKEILFSSGFTKGEIRNLLGSKTKVKEKESRLEQLKEDLYIRYRLKIKLLFEHLKDFNMLETFQAQREEDEHLINSLTRLGDNIQPLQENEFINNTAIKIEPFILKSLEEEGVLNPQLSDGANLS